MKRFLTYSLTGLLLFVFGCNTTPDPVLTVTPENLAFSAEGGAQTVQVKANNPWTASASGTGISVNPSSGEGDATVTVTATATNSTNPLSGTVTFRSEGLAATVSVTQDERKVIQVGDVMVIPADGGTFAVDIQYNTDYTVEVEASAKSWISFLGTRALQSGKLEFQFAENGNTEPRQGAVTVKDKSGKVSDIRLTFVQEEKKVIQVGDVMEIPAEGGTFMVDVQYNTDFDVVVESGAQSWITFVATRALKSGKLEFRFAENQSTDPRQGIVTVKDKSGKVSDFTLTFVQEEKKVITVGDVMTIPAEGGTFMVDIQYNTDFDVVVESGAQSWITFVATRALKSGKLEFRFAENQNTDPRQGTVTVKDKSGKVSDITLTFVQEEKKVITVGDVMTIPAEGGTFMVDIQYNTNFDIEVAADAKDWITFVATRTLTSGKLEFWIMKNDGPQRTGTVTVKSKTDSIEPIILTFKQLADEKMILARSVMTGIYEALGARNWTDPWIPGETWPGFEYDKEKGTVIINISGKGAKGTIPESIGDFGDMIVSLTLQNEPGVTGTLPDSFRKLVNLKTIYIRNTSMTSLPDLFDDMKDLESITILNNEKMTGSLPESIGNCTKLSTVHFGSNMFTGNVPASWSRFSRFCFVFENCLSGKVSVFCHTPADVKGFVSNGNLWQQNGYGFDISDVDVPGHKCWPDGSVTDLDGNSFSFDDVISHNKYTVYLAWDNWTPFALSLMPELKDYYDQYHKDGLEVIATIMLGPGAPWKDLEGQKKLVSENGYDQWYNFYWPSVVDNYYLSFTPAVEVYDSKGNILFSSFSEYPDPVRDRFSKNVVDLIPFLETLLGPANIYTSTDYSKDGEVTTLQSASVGKGVNVVFIGDAFTDQDMGSGGLYEKVMSEAMEEFFAIEPYKTFRNRFNVYAVKAVSPNGKIGNRYSTALSCYYGGGTTVLGDHDKCFEYALKVPGIDNQDNLVINVMVNSERNIGTTFMSYMRQSSVCFITTAYDKRDMFGPVLRHEAGGHGMAFLADEYANYSGTPPTDHVNEYNSRFEDYGWYSNVDFTNDPTKIRWKAFLSDSRYNGQVGIFEGAALYEQGAYRSTEKSIMRYLDESDEFNAPSRWKIYQQIMDRSGEECSFEKFLEYDAVNRAAASQSSVRPPLKAAAKVKAHRQTAPPVIIK